MKSKNFLSSAKNAFFGIRAVVRRERNFRIQLFIAIAVVTACIFFQVSAQLFLWVAFAIFFVLSMELVNTAVEAVIDLVCKNTPHPLAKFAKDAAAGAVLLASAFAVVVGIVVTNDIIRRFL